MAIQIVCAHCQRPNRVPEDRLGDNPKCGACKQTILSAAPIEMSATSFPKHIKNDQLPVVVDFWASWCGPCQMMAPEFAKVSETMNEKAIFGKVNTETEQQIAAQYGIRSIPTIILFKNGAEKARVAGAMNAPQLQQWIAQNS